MKVSPGQADEFGVDAGGHDQDDLDAAHGGRDQRGHHRFFGDEVGGGEDDFLAGRVDGFDQDGFDGLDFVHGSGGKDLDGGGAGSFLHFDASGGAQAFEAIARFERPVFQEGDGEGFDGGALDADHGIDPFADGGVLLEVAGIDQVHAAGVGDFAVDDDDLAVQPQVEADEQGADEANGEG